MHSLEANNPLVVLLAVLVSVATLDALIGFRLLPRTARFFVNNLAVDPLARRASRRETVQREEVTKEVVANLKEIVSEAITDTLKTTNDGASIPDLRGDIERLTEAQAESNRRQEAQHLATVSLETTMHAFAARLSEVGRKSDVATGFARKSQELVAEYVSEQNALTKAAREGTINRRKS
jgi:hypothetical protein